MENFCVRDILKATGGKLLCGDESTEIVNFATNSGKSAPGLMFAPIIGERVDGHRFIAGAFECGASGTLTQRAEAADEVIDRWKKNNEQPKPVILVNDTVEAMQRTARAYEGRLHLKKAGVTGSVGKTTTKEMIACALSGGLKVFKTAGNANSQIGVPVTLMNISSQDEAAVIEMGMSEEGEMKRLATLLTLDTVVITNIGVSHIEQLGTQENILREKWHITDALRDGGTILLNGDDPLLMAKARRCRQETQDDTTGLGKRKLHIYTFGRGSECDYRAQNIETDEHGISFEMIHGDVCQPVSLRVFGEHNVNNALAALAVSESFGVELKAAAQALSEYTGVAMRQQITVKDNITFIDDSYNASPDSMRAGINVLCQMPAKYRVAVLADMLELGDNTKEYHRQVGEYAGSCGIDELVLYGELSRCIGYGAEQYTKLIHHFDSLEEVVKHLKEHLKEGTAVLFKGSRGMKLNEVVDSLLDRK